MMLECLVFLWPASRAHGGHPPPGVLRFTLALHLCPQRSHLQGALMLLLAVAVTGVLPALASQSHSAATSGLLWATSLQGHTAVPLLFGHPALFVRFGSIPCHLCSCPVLHMPLLHQAFLLL